MNNLIKSKISEEIFLRLQLKALWKDGHRSRGDGIRVHRLSAEGAEQDSVPQHPHRAGRGQDGDLRGGGAAAALHLPGLRSGGLRG